MYKVYEISTVESDKMYIGMTKNTLAQRLWQHKDMVNKGSNLKSHNWMRKYLTTISITSLYDFETKEECSAKEKELIARYKDKVVNIAPGGEGGFVVQDVESWKEKLREKRKGRQPALGLKHTEENKAKFKEYTENRVPKYPIQEVIRMSFKDASSKYGISKSHYLRLRHKYGFDLANQSELNVNQKEQSLN
jgi:hypothetical protein